MDRCSRKPGRPQFLAGALRAPLHVTARGYLPLWPYGRLDSRTGVARFHPGTPSTVHAGGQRN